MCTELGQFTTSDNSEQPFGNYFSLDYYVQLCTDNYGRPFDKQEMQKAIDKTNSVYGGLSLTNLSNVVFVNGLVDPWRELSVLKADPSNPTVILIVIPETSHCADLGSDDVADSQNLKNARMQVVKAIEQFLQTSADDY